MKWDQFPDGKEITILPLVELPTEIQQAIAKTTNDIKLKTCFNNALLLSFAHPEIHYVEGFAVSKTTGIPIEHAWNKYKDIYFDATSIVLFENRGKEKAFDEYFQLAIIEDLQQAFAISQGTLRIHSLYSRKFNIRMGEVHYGIKTVKDCKFCGKKLKNINEVANHICKIN